MTGNSLQCYGKSDGIPAIYAVGLAEDRLGNLWVGSPVLFRGRPGAFETQPVELRDRVYGPVFHFFGIASVKGVCS